MEKEIRSIDLMFDKKLEIGNVLRSCTKYVINLSINLWLVLIDI